MGRLLQITFQQRPEPQSFVIPACKIQEEWVDPGVHAGKFVAPGVRGRGGGRS